MFNLVDKQDMWTIDNYNQIMSLTKKNVQIQLVEVYLSSYMSQNSIC